MSNMVSIVFPSLVQDFSFSNSYEQGIVDCLEWHLHNLKDIKKGA